MASSDFTQVVAGYSNMDASVYGGWGTPSAGGGLDASFTALITIAQLWQVKNKYTLSVLRRSLTGITLQ